MQYGIDAPSLVFSPRNLTETFALFGPNPHAQIYAGGTASPEQNLGSLKLPPVAVSLHLVEDLRRIQYGDRFVDLGAGLPLNQILHVAKSFLNPALRQAVLGIGNNALRNLGTLGGNLCQKGFLGDIFPVLHLLGAQFEFRSQRTSRWISAAQASEAGRLTAKPGELMTKVRIPQEEWPLHFYQKIGNFRTPWDERLAMVALSRTKNGLLDAFRLIFYLPHAGILRDRALEAEFVGQKLPLGAKARDSALGHIELAMNALALPPSVFQRDRILHLTRWVLAQIQED
ncbi:MAG: hypothetical protein HKM06_07415 [Spirochaetales bacterium]|nr:hypothetical protein [Spirochaetales bacterium]